MIVLQVAGFSDSGKTTVCRMLADVATRQGHVVGYIKHHDGPIERDGSGTDLLRQAGATHRWLTGSDGSIQLGCPADLEVLISAAKAAGCGFVLVEGFKSQRGAKCWLRRHADDATPASVPDVGLDMLGAEAMSLGAEELMCRMPWRDV